MNKNNSFQFKKEINPFQNKSKNNLKKRETNQP